MGFGKRLPTDVRTLSTYVRNRVSVLPFGIGEGLLTYLRTYLPTYVHPYVRTRMNVRTCVSRLWPNGLGLTALAFCPATASLARLSQTTDPRLNVRLNVRLTGDHPPSQITPDGTRIIVTYDRTDVSTQPCSKLLGNFPLSPLSRADHAVLFFSIHFLSL